MRVGLCSKRPVLEPCSLASFAYQLDTYVGCEHHCYYCYALNQAETNWAKEILMHQDLAGELNRELSVLKPQPIYVGWNSDPYQPAEKTRCQTRQALELLARHEFSACVLTKSDLVVRDIDLLAKMPNASAGVSIAFQNDHVRRLFEAEAPPNERRIEALKELREAGIRTYALICPVMPFISDVAPLIEALAQYADTLWIYPLSIEVESNRNWQNVQGILDRHFPDEMKTKYRQIAFSASHPHWASLRRELERLQVVKSLDMRICL